MTATRTPPALALALLLLPAWAQAQSLGQFQWQLSPFCNVVTVNVTQNGSIYTLDGFDNQCGVSNPRAPLVGVATPNPDGSIGFGLTIVTPPNGTPVHVRATIQLPALNGTWSDSAGNTGTFMFGTTTQTTNRRPDAMVLPLLSVAGSGSFGGPLSAPSVSISGGGTFGGTVTADSVVASGVAGILRAEGASNTGQPQMVFTRALGTPGAPAAVTSSTNLGTTFWAGFNGSTYPNAAIISAFSSEDWTPTAHGSRLVFSTTANGTTAIQARMRILDNGRVGINTTTPDQFLSVNGDASKVGGGAWLVFSDERLKTVHGPFTRGLTDLLRLQPIRYEYTPDNPLGLHGTGEYIGFSAQAVRTAIPEAVTESTAGYLQVNADPILWTMLNAIKELKGTNDELSSRNAELERRLAALEARTKRP